MRTRIKINIAHWHWTFCLSCVLAWGRNYITHGLVQDPCASQAVHLKGFIVVSVQRGPYMGYFFNLYGKYNGTILRHRHSSVWAQDPSRKSCGFKTQRGSRKSTAPTSCSCRHDTLTRLRLKIQNLDPRTFFYGARLIPYISSSKQTC